MPEVKLRLWLESEFSTTWPCCSIVAQPRVTTVLGPQPGVPGTTEHCLDIFVVQSLSRVFVIPWTAARQASLSFTVYWSLLKFMSIESVMQSKQLILCHPLLLLPSIFPSISVFSNESALHIRWPKYGASASASVLSMNIQG